MATTFNTDILLERNPTSALMAATKQYVDSSVTAITTTTIINGGSSSTPTSGSLVLRIDFGASV